MVTREEILCRVWQGARIGNSTLNWSVAQLRKALGDEARNPQFIKTIPKRGYRLIAPVRFSQNLAGASMEQDDSFVTPNPVKISIRPFLMLTACILLGIMGSGRFHPSEPQHSEGSAVSLFDTGEGIASPYPSPQNTGREIRDEPLSSKELYLLGCHHMKRRGTTSLKKAVAYFRSAIEKDPYATQSYAGLADAYGLMAVWGNIPFKTVDAKRERAIQRALALNPNAAEAWVSQGCLQYHRGQLQAAVESFRKAIAINPKIAKAHLWLGDALRAQGQFQSASDSQKTALELDPLSPIGHLDLGYSLHMLGEHESALDHMETAINLDPDFAAAYQEIGETHFRLGRPGLAMSWFQQALILEPERGALLRHSARVLLDLDRPDLAKPYLEQLARVDPDHPESLDLNLRWACATGRLETHWFRLQSQLTRSPDDPNLVRNGALALYLMDRQEDALASFKRIDDHLPQRVNFRNWMTAVRLAFLLKQKGNGAETAGFLDELHNFAKTLRRNGYNLPDLHFITASALAALDQPQAALAELNKAVEGGWVGLWSLKHEPHLRQLSSHGDFWRTMARLQSKGERAVTAFLSQP